MDVGSIHGGDSAGVSGGEVVLSLDGVEPESDGRDGFGQFGEAVRIGEGFFEAGGALAEIAGVGIENGEGDGQVVQGGVVCGIVDGMGLEEGRGGAGGVRLAEDKDLGEGGERGAGLEAPAGFGGGFGGGQIALEIESGGKAVHQGELVVGCDFFRAGGEGFGIFPGGEEVEGDGGFRAENGRGGDAAAETSGE